MRQAPTRSRVRVGKIARPRSYKEPAGEIAARIITSIRRPERAGCNPHKETAGSAGNLRARLDGGDVLRVLDRLEEIIIATLIAAATLVIFIAVVHRYSIGASVGALNWGKAHDVPWVAAAGKAAFLWLKEINLTWAQELCIYMFVWMAKFGAAYGVRTGIHVGVDVATGALGATSRHRVVMFGLLVRRAVHLPDRVARRAVRLPHVRDRGALARSRNPELDRLSRHSARQLSDVLPLPAGGVDLLAHGRTAASRSRPCRGRRGSGAADARRPRPRRRYIWRPPREAHDERHNPDASRPVRLREGYGRRHYPHCRADHAARALPRGEIRTGGHFRRAARDAAVHAAHRHDDDGDADLDRARPHRARLLLHHDP